MGSDKRWIEVEHEQKCLWNRCSDQDSYGEENCLWGEWYSDFEVKQARWGGEGKCSQGEGWRVRVRWSNKLSESSVPSSVPYHQLYDELPIKARTAKIQKVGQKRRSQSSSHLTLIPTLDYSSQPQPLSDSGSDFSLQISFLLHSSVSSFPLIHTFLGSRIFTLRTIFPSSFNSKRNRRVSWAIRFLTFRC